MKSVGETMAIGRTFKEALQKGLRSLEIGRHGLGADGRDRVESDGDFPSETQIHQKLAIPNSQRLFYLRYALLAGMAIHRGHPCADRHRSVVPAPDAPDRGDGAAVGRQGLGDDGRRSALAGQGVGLFRRAAGPPAGRRCPPSPSTARPAASGRSTSWWTPAPPSSGPPPPTTTPPMKPSAKPGCRSVKR
jgi:hypothetical protein